MSEENKPKPHDVPFSAQAVRDGYWEVFHDDDCGEVLVNGFCPKCGFSPDLQSLGARRVEKKQ